MPSIRADFRASSAGACVTKPQFAEEAPDGMVALLLSDKPYKAYALIAQALYPQAGRSRRGIAASALIDPCRQGLARGGDRSRAW